MNILGVGTNYFAFAGKTSVYVKAVPKTTLSNPGADDENPAELPAITFAPEWIAKDGHIECVAISNDDRLVAVADSMHGLHLFKMESFEEPKWVNVFTKTSNKRVIKLQFTSERQFLTLLDKQGDIYAVQISDLSRISNIKKIMGHTSFISDYLIRSETKQIVSCDRDEKIRISNFPDAFLIQGFKLGHIESVINISLLNINVSGSQRMYLLSISLTGTLLLWDFDKPVDGTETSFLKMWNIKELLPTDIKETGVKLMKAVSIHGKAYFCVVFTGSSKIYVFQLSVIDFEISLLQELESGTENILVEWSSSSLPCSSLIVYMPEIASIKSWRSGESSLQNDIFTDLEPSIITDLKASAESLKPSVVPMKKRLTFEDSQTLFHEQDVKKVKT